MRTIRRFETTSGRLLSCALALILYLPEGEARELTATSDLLSLSLEELTNVEVFSASKRNQEYYATAAAIFVISSEDIRRAGARSIPDALRLAPGVEVQNLNANHVAVAIRGQNDLFSRKLLVLMDGRPLYNPTFSGVWWIAQHYPMEDIERIEIVRGPGGAVWGANAVNGVINIITKTAQKTQGAMLSAGAGNEERGFGSLRLGGNSDAASFRIYAMNESRDGGIAARTNNANTTNKGFTAGQETPDRRRFSQTGFRLDSEQWGGGKLSLHGDIYDLKAGGFGEMIAIPGRPMVNYRSSDTYRGHNMVLDYQRELTADLHLRSNLFYDHYRYQVPLLMERRDTWEGELQLDLHRFTGQTLSAGAALRRSSANFTDTSAIRMPDRSTSLYSLFVNDDWQVSDRWRLIGGVKYERNSYSGWETQPSLRTLWQGEGWGIWAAASKAVRIQSDNEMSVAFDVTGGNGGVGRIYGDGNIQPERITTYEAGLRLYPDPHALFELTAFEINYRGNSDVISTKIPGPGPGYAIIPIYLRNVLNGRGRGIEANLKYKPVDRLTLRGSYSYLHQNYWPHPTVSNETLYTAYTVTQQTPRNRYTLGLSLNPTLGSEIDLDLFHHDAFRQGFIHSYNRLDGRIALHPSPEVEISLTGKNLLQATHREEINNYINGSSLVQQSFFMQIKIDR